MKEKVGVLVIRTAGTNCDLETVFAFQFLGAEVELLHINFLVQKKELLKRYHILVIPGGFTYGDDISAGKILANELKQKLKDELEEFIREGKLILGICNGFQVLVKCGILPNPDFSQRVSLVSNDSAKFEARWVYLKVSNNSIWTENLPSIIRLPVAHAEGKFVTKDSYILEELKNNSQIAFQYVDLKGEVTSVYPFNPNGSEYAIAGITDPKGRILGLMPHPERYIFNWQAYDWTSNLQGEPCGLLIFKNAINYVKKNLL